MCKQFFENKIFFILFLCIGVFLNAADIVIDDTNTTMQVLNSGDSLYVTNNGKLTVDGTAVLPQSGDINIKNNGIIQASNIAVFIDSLTGTITNETAGTITADTSAVYMNNNFGNIVNNGLIESNLPIFTGTNDGNITNNSVLKGVYFGIYIEKEHNKGNIINNGIIQTTNGSGITLFFNESGDNYGAVINKENGEIISNTEDGINMLFGLNELGGSIINEGNITAARYGVSSYTNNGLISNTGNIVALKDGIYVAESNNGSIINTGIITAQNYAVNIVYEGTGTVINSGIMNGNLNINSTGVVTNSGIINLKGSVTSLISGDYVQTSSATIGIDANITGGNSATYSKLQVAGKALLADGTNIKVNVLGLSANQTDFLNSNSRLNDVISASVLEVNVSKLNITDNSYMLDFTAFKDGDNLDLLTVQDSTIQEAVESANTTSQSGEVAKVLDETTGGEDIDEFKSYLYTLPDNNLISKAVASITPSETVATSSSVLRLVNTMSRVIESRQASVRGFNSGDIVFSDKNIWVKPFGEYIKQDNKGGVTGYLATGFGVGVGIDGEYEIGNRAGVAFFYTKTHVKTNDIDQSSDLNVFNFITYGSKPLIDDKTNLFYQLGFGLQETHTSRYVPGINKTANGYYNAKNYYAQLKITKEFTKEYLIIRPAVTASYVYYKNPAYTESGAGGMNLHVEEFSSNSCLLGVQNEFDYKLNTKTKILSNIAVNYDFNNKAQSVNSNFTGGGASFSTQGIKNNPLIYKAGIGIAKKLNKVTYLDFKYDLEWRGSDFLSYSVSAKYNYKF
jgi:uncharacterized protein with beta-barrel porin domain